MTLEAPTVKTEKATEVTRTTAKLNATVNPNGDDVTTCQFEYVTAKHFEFYGYLEAHSVPCSSLPGSGSSPVSVSATTPELSANTTYHFRISATSSGGTSEGADETFRALPFPPDAEAAGASEITRTSAELNGFVGPEGAETVCRFEYGTSLAYGSSKPCDVPPGSTEGAVFESVAISELSANTTYHFRIVAENAGGQSEGRGTFTTLPNPPTVKTEKASEIGQTTAKLNASVNPNGGEVTECKLEYGPTTSYGESKPCSPSAGSGEGAVSVSASISGLTANTTYHFRVVAKNAGGESKGADETLKTLPKAPTVKTEKASEIGQTTAKLNASVNPNAGDVTNCKFEYATARRYEFYGYYEAPSVPCSSLPGSGSGSVAVSATLKELPANATYHFRISATNSGGTSEGSDETLKTQQSCTAEGFCNNLTHFQGEAGFSEPDAVAVDPSGDIFVADSAKDQILEFNSERKLLRQFGSEGSGEGQFKGIGAIAANSAGDVYVTDPGNHRVQEFGPAGEHLRSFGSSTLKGGQLLAPTGIAIDSAGDVWVLNAAGASGDRIVEFSSEGAELTKFGANGSGAGQLGQAYGLAISGGNLYVSEEANSRVQELSTSGEFIRAFDEKGSGSGQSNQPYAIATEASTGDLYVTEVGSDRVQVFSPEGAFLTTFGSPGSGEGQLSDPKGIALSSSGTIYVADTGNRRLQEWAPGSPPTFTTSIARFSSTEAGFSEPDAVAVDPSGDIFVADSAKDQILEFNSERKLLRQFGSEGSGEGQFKGIGAIAANSAGDVYVTDPGNHRVQEFGPAGEHLRSFGSSTLKGGQLLAPTGIAIDSAGDVWVLNAAGASGDRIVEFSSEGAELTKFGANGSGAGQLGQAYGLAISGGNLYVSEEANSRVQELSTSGEFIRAFDEKGSGSGQSNQPYAIATEASTGDLYVTEVGSDRVQVFSPEGAFLTTFGSPGSGEGQLSDPKGIALSSSGTIYVADTGNRRLQEWLAAP